MSIAIGSDKVKMASNVSCFIILEKTKRKYKLSVSITIANWGCFFLFLWVNLRYGVYG